MENITKLRGMLFTLGNVTTSLQTKHVFPNPDPDPIAKQRSQELYDALSRKLDIVAWACGRYGHHGYSPERGRLFAEELLERLNRADELDYDYSFQMAGHPIIHHKKPYFILIDFIPYFDLSVLDTVAFPYVKVQYERDQDFLYKEATGIITYTPVQRYMLINWFNINPCKVTSICSGVKGLVESDFQKRNTKMILWVGADYDRKGGDDVIKAFKLLHEKDPSYTLTMVGVTRPEIAGQGIAVYPFLHDEDLDILDALYKEAAVFVMPSYKENLGLVYLEAMARKTPVIVTSRGGFAEVIRRTGAGEVVVPGDIHAICSSIEKILNPTSFEGYSERAYYFAAHNATWDVAAQRIVDAMGKWMCGEPVPDDYNDYSMDERFQFYNGIVSEGLR